MKFQALREQKKVNAGAQFFQTNLIFDIDGMEIWLNELAKQNVLDKVYILAGVTPIKSLKVWHKNWQRCRGFIFQKIFCNGWKLRIKLVMHKEGIQIALEIICKIKTYEKRY